MPGSAPAGFAPDWAASLLQSCAALVLVCCAAYLGIRAWGRRRGKRGSGGPALESLTSLSLAPGASLHVVRVGPRRLLLGVTAQSISMLQQLDSPPDLAPPAGPEEPGSAPRSVAATQPSPSGPVDD